MEGITEYKTSQGVHICRLHYTADPDKRSEEWKAATKLGMSENDWEREYEINPNAPRGMAWYPEFRYDFHVAKGPLQPIEGRPITRLWDYGLCYDDKTEVLTAAGWKLFKDVDADKDLAATKNPETKRLEYTPINFKVAKPYKGKLIGWASQTINFLVTPEHRVPFTYRETPDNVVFESAKWLAEHSGGHHYVDLTASWDGKDVDVIIGNITMTAVAYAEFMGLYLSEGNCDHRKNVVQIAQTEYSEYMSGILQNTGLTWTWRKNNRGEGSFTCSNKGLNDHLQQFGYSHEKHVPDIIKNASSQTISLFVDAYTYGDGHVRTRPNGSPEHTIYTVSGRMAGDMQELALKMGIHSSLRWVPPQTSVIKENCRPERTITGNGGYQITFKKKATRGELLKRNYFEQEYDGTVYCLNVPHHTLFVRRNGKTSWNGNTPATAFAQTTAKAQMMILYPELQSEDCGITAHGKVVQSESATWFPGFQFNDIGDPAGNQRAQTDEKSCNDILKELYGIRVSPGVVSFTARDEALRKLLTTTTPDGQPMFLIDPRDKWIIAAFRGGYQRKEVAGVYTDDPDKNMFSHIMDAIQYGAASIYKMAARPEFVNRQQGGRADGSDRNKFNRGYRRGN